MSSANVLNLTDENFDAEVMAKGVTAMVDFWAEWCMPCKILAPTIEALADEFAGRVKVCKVNTDNARNIALRFNISAIPTVILFKDARPVKQMVGLQSKKDFKAALEAALQQGN
jgi:thioredoxin 1